MKNRPLAAWICLLANAILLGCGASQVGAPTPTPSPIGGGSGRIAFVSDRDGNMEIYVMNADGSEQTNLTNNEADDEWPTMSPQGTQVVFVSNRDEPSPQTCMLNYECNSELYMVRTDGTGLTRLTDNPASDSFPIWSPDGAQIAFNSNRDGPGDIFVMGADGSGQINLTNDREFDFYPRWMPDAAQIVFLSTRDGGFQFYIVNTDGSELTMLDSGLPPSELTSSQLRSWAMTVGFEIYIYDGEVWSGIQDKDSSLGEYPTWSPDGRRIAFHSRRDGNMEIYLMNADYSGLTRLTSNEADDMFPAWSPDGMHIAFHSNRDGNEEIYVMDADGSNQTRLTFNSESDTRPAWYP